jgi:hypothetical protein
MGYTISSPDIEFVNFVQLYKYLAGDYDPNQPGDVDASQEPPMSVVVLGVSVVT